MLYRLLRNNKESGPYTALQLKEMGLKPYDLLWTEGRGAAWQYASEITELKNFAPLVEEQPFDRFFKRNEALQATQQTTVAAKKVKPRFRISNGQLIMVEAGNMEVANNGVIKETMPALPKESPVVAEKKVALPGWQDTYSEWQPSEKKTQEKAEKKEEAIEVETKYSESLDDLKKRYAEKVLNEKTTKPSSFSSSSVKQNIMAAVALLVLAVGGYIGYTLKQKDAVVTEGKPLVERADIAGDNSLSSQAAGDDVAASEKDEKAKLATQLQSNIAKSNEQTKTEKRMVEKPLAATVVKKITDDKQPVNASQKNEVNPVNKANTATSNTTDKKIVKTVVANDKKKESANAVGNSIVANKQVAQPAVISAKIAANATVPAPVDTKPVAKQNTQKRIDDYISVKKLGGSANAVQNVRLLVNNVTDFPIDLAVIDIQYYDSKGKYQKGETMYVKNIDGGNNVEVRVPDSEKSSSIKYKVSMVSSEQKTLYLVAD